MNPAGIIAGALDLIANIIADARAANDAAAVAAFEALVSDHEVGAILTRSALAAQARIDAARAKLAGDTMGTPLPVE